MLRTKIIVLSATGILAFFTFSLKEKAQAALDNPSFLETSPSDEEEIPPLKQKKRRLPQKKAG